MTTSTSVGRVPAAIYRGGIAASGLLAGTLLLSIFGGLHGPPCPVWYLYHVHCPGCGITRSLAELWRGHLLLSLRYHPLGLPLFTLAIAMALAAAADLCLPRLRPALRRAFARGTSARVMAPVAGVLLILWVARLVLEAQKIQFFLW